MKTEKRQTKASSLIKRPLAFFSFFVVPSWFK